MSLIEDVEMQGVFKRNVIDTGVVLVYIVQSVWTLAQLSGFSGRHPGLGLLHNIFRRSLL